MLQSTTKNHGVRNRRHWRRSAVTATLVLVALTGSAQTGVPITVNPSTASLMVGESVDLHAIGDFPEGPRELSQALSIAGGEYHGCAALNSGEAYCWGGNDLGQLGDGSHTASPLPVRVAGLPPASTVATGRWHSCALLLDQTVMCWGANGNGQLGDGTTADASAPVAVQGITGAIAVSAGAAHTCALLGSGGIRCWGSDANGELGDGMATGNYPGYSALPVDVAGIADATAVAAGGLHVCALRADGRVNCWGGNLQGAIGDGSLDRAYTPVEVSGLTDAIGVAAGLFHSCAQRANGSVACWGGNGSGTLGNGGTTDSTVPVAVTGLSGVASLASGWGARHQCAVLLSGGLRCWGDNGSGQLGDGTQIPRSSPVDVTGVGQAIEATLGRQHSCVLLADGSVNCWGENNDGQLGDATNVARVQPVAVTDLTVSWHGADTGVAIVGVGGGVIARGAGSAQILATASGGNSASATVNVQSRLSVSATPDGAGQVSSDDGRIACGATCTATYASAQQVTLDAAPASGYAFAGWRGDCSGTDPCTLDTASSHAVSAEFVSSTYTLSVTTSGDGRVTSTPAGIDCGSTCSQSLAGGSVLSLGASPGPGAYFVGWTGACAGTGTCQISMAGNRSVSATFATRSLVSIDLGPATASMAAGTSRRLTAMGQFNDGSSKPVSGSVIELGDGYSCALMQDGSLRCWGGSPAPFSLSGAQAPASLAAGTSHACSVLGNGQVMCWGRNVEGQLGDGTTLPPMGAVNVSGLTNAAAVVGGSKHSCSLDTSGGVACWGAAGYLGDAAGQSSSTPVGVADAGPALLLSNEAGAPTCVLSGAGEVRCWNMEVDGAMRATPTLRSGLGAAAGVTAAPIHACALLANGQVKCWGRTDYGILGDGGPFNGQTTSGPVVVSGITNAIAVALGDLHSCALLADRTVKCWGNGSLGQLGNGQTANSNVPVAVSGLTDVTALAAGDHHSCAVTRSGSIRCWGENHLQQLGVPTAGLNVRSTAVTAIGLPPAAAVEWSSSDPGIAGVTAQGIVVPRQPGSVVITASVNGVSDSVALTVTGNTVTGNDVQVTPVNAATAATPATLTYATVTQPGQTAITAGNSGPAVPAGFRVGSPAIYYDLTTTALFSGPITVCLRYDGVAFEGTTPPRLFHYESNAWVDRTTSVDANLLQVCGVVSSLSPFALLQSSDRTPPTLKCSVDPASLRPPNHRMIEVKASIQVSDGGSGPAGFVLRSVVSNEADAGLGSDDVPGDISGFVPGTASVRGALRAERYGRDGRTYTLEFEGADRAGNTNRCKVAVKVPQNVGG